VLADDPLLTARDAYRSRKLVRVIFDRRLRTPPSARMFSTLEAGPVVIMTSDRARADAPDRARALVAAGAQVVAPAGDDFKSALRALFDAGVTSLVLEGGPSLHRAALSADIVDAVHVYVAARRLGPGGVAWLDERRLAWETLDERHAAWLGEDVLVEGQLRTHVHGDR
jgi:diaminohydroxyphosphoribosylaminopyrimidine deaminase/5-amino-6-(5-phosphoribosylamino)uracil reductase